MDEEKTFPPLLVTETLQYRLVTGNISKLGGQKGSLTRCVQKFGTLQSELKSNNDSNKKNEDDNDNANEESESSSVQATKQELAHELELYRLEMTKLILLQQNLQSQVELNQQAKDDREAEIEQLSQQVQESQDQASQWQETRKCYLDYESLAKLVNENPHPSRKLKEQIAQIKHDIGEYQKQEASTDQVLKVRESQFQLLVQYMLDLKRSLEEGDQDIVAGATKQEENTSEHDKGENSIEGQKETTPMEVEEDDGLYGDLE